MTTTENRVFHVTQPDILEQLRAGLKLESLAVEISNPLLVEAAKEAVNQIERQQADINRLVSERQGWLDEVEIWKDRYEAERQDHEATMKAWDEERSGW